MSQKQSVTETRTTGSSSDLTAAPTKSLNTSKPKKKSSKNSTLRKLLTKLLAKLNLQFVSKSKMPSGPLAGKLAIVTGSSRGIGASIALKLAASGASVLINYVSDSSKELSEEFAAKLRKDYGVQAGVFQGDLTQPLTAAPALIASAAEQFGESHRNEKTGNLQIDIIVHNAAHVSWTPLGTMGQEVFDRHFHANVLAPILIQQAASEYLPHDRSGRIIFISSTTTKMGGDSTSLYTGSKGAVEAMIKVWAKELALRATVNAVQPGPTTTPSSVGTPDAFRQYVSSWVKHAPLTQMTEEEMKDFSEEERRQYEISGGRRAKPEEIADVVYLLALPESGWVTGQTIEASGGMF